MTIHIKTLHQMLTEDLFMLLFYKGYSLQNHLLSFSDPNTCFGECFFALLWRDAQISFSNHFSWWKTSGPQPATYKSKWKFKCRSERNVTQHGYLKKFMISDIKSSLIYNMLIWMLNYPWLGNKSFSLVTAKQLPQSSCFSIYSAMQAEKQIRSFLCSNLSNTPKSNE